MQNLNAGAKPKATVKRFAHLNEIAGHAVEQHQAEQRPNSAAAASAISRAAAKARTPTNGTKIDQSTEAGR